MLIVVSPAKTLDYESPLVTSRFTQPELLDHSAELIGRARQLSPDQIASLMKISDKLARGRTISFEFFPPKTDVAARDLEKTIGELEPLGLEIHDRLDRRLAVQRVGDRDLLVSFLAQDQAGEHRHHLRGERQHSRKVVAACIATAMPANGPWKSQ